MDFRASIKSEVATNYYHYLLWEYLLAAQTISLSSFWNQQSWLALSAGQYLVKMQSKLTLHNLLLFVTFQILCVPLIAGSSHTSGAKPGERQIRQSSLNCPKTFLDHFCHCLIHSINCYPDEGATPFTAFPVSNENYTDVTIM